MFLIPFDAFIQDKSTVLGWDWSYIGDRISMEPLPWNYKSITIPYIRSSNSMFDMGTGGGELLKTLQPFPKRTFASENYRPNFEIAKASLNKLGVEMISFDNDSNIPLEDGSFDLVINRHESYSSNEVYRILKSGGYFITQQVGDPDSIKLNELIGDNTPDTWENSWNNFF